MVRRALAITFSIVVPAAAAAELSTVWSKSLKYQELDLTGFDCQVDESGAMYVLAVTYTPDASEDVFVAKIGLDGRSIWINRLKQPGDQMPVKIRLGSNGLVYVLSRSDVLTQSDVALRSLRASDGGTVWQHSWKTETKEAPLDLVVDSLNNVYTASVEKGFFHYRFPHVVVRKVRFDSPESSPTFRAQCASGQSLLRSFARPAGGMYFVMANGDSTAEDFREGSSYSSNLYFASPEGVFSAPIPMGFASAFAVDPVTDKVYCAGVGILPPTYIPADFWVARAPFQGNQEYSRQERLIKPQFRSALISKDHQLHVAGTYYNQTNGAQTPAWFVSDLDGFFFRPLPLETGEGKSRLNFIETDRFGGIFATDYPNFSNLHELDSESKTQVDYRPLGYPVTALSVGGQGHVGSIGSNRASLHRPLHLKDLYMGSTAITGGSTRTAIVRAYEPVSYPRMIALTHNGGPNVQIPSSAEIPAGAVAVSFLVATGSVSTPLSVKIKATLGKQLRSFQFSVLP